MLGNLIKEALGIRVNSLIPFGGGSLADSGAAPATRSAWFDGSADYLSRSMGTPDDQSKWIVSVWFRRTRFGTAEYLVVGGTSASTSTWYIGFNASNQFVSVDGAGSNGIITNRVFRDSEWTHAVFSFDSDDSTAGDRCRLWINGVEETSFATDNTPTSGATFNMNASGQTHTIGANLTGPSNVFLGKIAQVLFLDGESIQDSSHAIGDFGANESIGTNGSAWVAKADSTMAGHASSAGGNSFCLASDLGDGTDDSSNGNNFTATSMSDAANGSNDSPPTPLPLFSVLHKSGVTATLSEGGQRSNLATGAGWLSVTQLVPPTGKYYVEFLANTVTSGNMAVGVCNPRSEQDGSPRASGFLHWEADGDRYLDGAQTATEVTAWAATNVVGLGINMDGKQLLFYDKDGNLDATVAFGSNVDGSEGVLLYLGNLSGSGAQNATLIIESSAMTHGLPTGYSELKIGSLPAPSAQGADVFQTLLYTGNNANNRDITGAGFKPDLLWLAIRNAAINNKLIDSSRGVSAVSYSNGNDAETTEGGLDSFQSDGIRVDNVDHTNGSGNNYVAWLWKGNNGTTATNNNGSTSTSVQVSSAGHMSIATLTAPGGNATYGHGLSGAPGFVTIKRRNGADAWYSWMSGMGGTQYATLDTNDAVATNSVVYTALPTSTVVNGGTIFGAGTYVMYCFRTVPGVCQIGTYVGNGDADGPMLNVGFEGRWIMIKSSDSGGWIILDTARDTVQPLDNYISANADTAEGTTSGIALDALAHGFKIKGADSAINFNGRTYHYMAIANVATGTDLYPIPGR